MWKYYDFRANWHKVLPTWKSEVVQWQLVRDMNAFCQAYPYNILDKNGNYVCRIFHPNDEVWDYSLCDYWYEKAVQTARHNIFEDAPDFEQIVQKFLPQPDTFESILALGAKPYMVNTMHVLAKELFPNTHIYKQDDVNVIPDVDIIFDPFDYYFNKPIDAKVYKTN